MEYDGSKLKVKIDREDDDYHTFQVLEMPEEWRGVSDNINTSIIFEASNGFEIRSISHPAVGLPGRIYLRGASPEKDNCVCPFPICRLNDIVTALREFGATIVGNAACDDHEWVTVYEGDPTYEGTFCKNCLTKQS